MSLRRSARQSTTLLAKTNGTSPSVSSATRKRANGEDEPPQTQPKRVKKATPRDASATESATFKVPPVPVTPVRKRSAKATQPPQLTPTPSLVGLMRTPYSSGDIDDATPPPSESTVLPILSVNSIVRLDPAFFIFISYTMIVHFVICAFCFVFHDYLSINVRLKLCS